MKIVSFTMVNNESDIIESFIRYNSNFVDEMVIIDNGCSDHTMKIVSNLINEGYAITTYDESLEAYDQFRLDNKYIKKIIDEKSPDIIIPLDADEFLTGSDNPRRILDNLSLGCIYYVNWQWFVLTDHDDNKEPFIPRRLQYCFDKPVWNYSDNTPVTKTIIPARYYAKHNLKLSMGHHRVFGDSDIITKELPNLRLAHYRAISTLQIISKTMCYTLRDIATMDNNFETAQRTNQMYLIEQGKDMSDIVRQISYGGYKANIVHNPINLSWCTKSLDMKYEKIAEEPLTERILCTGQEMAIRAYNSERNKKEKKLLSPVLVCMDGVREGECVFPDPSNHITIMASMYNVRGYLTFREEIKFLKANYRLIVDPSFAKFLPHKYIIIPRTLDFESTRKRLMKSGIPSEVIISETLYKKHLTVFGQIYCYILFIPSFIGRICQYVKRNGITHAYNKIKGRVSGK